MSSHCQRFAPAVTKWTSRALTHNSTRCQLRSGFIERVSTDANAGGLNQEREIEANVRRWPGRSVKVEEKRGHHQRLRWRTQRLSDPSMQSGQGMLRGFGSQQLPGGLHGCFAAVVRLWRPTVTLLAAILSLLVRLWPGETIERPHEQEYCHEGDDDLQTTAHQVSPYQIAEACSDDFHPRAMEIHVPGPQPQSGEVRTCIAPLESW